MKFLWSLFLFGVCSTAPTQNQPNNPLRLALSSLTQTVYHDSNLLGDRLASFWVKNETLKEEEVNKYLKHGADTITSKLSPALKVMAQAADNTTTNPKELENSQVYQMIKKILSSYVKKMAFNKAKLLVPKKFTGKIKLSNEGKEQKLLETITDRLVNSPALNEKEYNATLKSVNLDLKALAKSSEIFRTGKGVDGRSLYPEMYSQTQASYKMMKMLTEQIVKDTTITSLQPALVGGYNYPLYNGGLSSYGGMYGSPDLDAQLRMQSLGGYGQIGINPLWQRPVGLQFSGGLYPGQQFIGNAGLGTGLGQGSSSSSSSSAASASSSSLNGNSLLSTGNGLYGAGLVSPYTNGIYPGNGYLGTGGLYGSGIGLGSNGLYNGLYGNTGLYNTGYGLNPVNGGSSLSSSSASAASSSNTNNLYNSLLSPGTGLIY